jgi:hypothetical protein
MGLGNRHSRLFGNGNTRDSEDNPGQLDPLQDRNLMLLALWFSSMRWDNHSIRGSLGQGWGTLGLKRFSNSNVDDRA